MSSISIKVSENGDIEAAGECAQQRVDPDAALVHAAQNGDTRAFDELIIKYSPKLYALIYHMTSNKDDAHDVLQDVFAKAYRSVSKFRGGSLFYTWMYTIATNTTLNFLKKSKRKAASSFDEMNADILLDPAFVDGAYQANPRRQTNINEIQKKLNEAMQHLSNDHRAVVTMFDIQGMAHGEIAQILGMSEGTVRSRLFYAHQQLRGYLSEFQGSELEQ